MSFLRENRQRAREWGNKLRQSVAPLRTKRSPLELASTGSSGTTAFGETEERAAAMEQYRYYRGKPYSAIQILTRRISGQPIKVARVRSGRQGERSLKHFIDVGIIDKELLPPSVKAINPENLEILESHPVLDMFQAPNEIMVKSTMLDVSVANLHVTGRALWLMADLMNGDASDQTWPLPTTWFKPVHDSGPFVEWDISPPGSMEEPIRVPNEVVAHFYFPDPSHPFKCISPLQMQARGIYAQEAMEIAQTEAFRNGVHPAKAIVVGEAAMDGDNKEVLLTADQRRTLINWIKQEYQGVQRYGTPMVLDALIKDVKDISRRPDEMAFLDSSQVNESGIFMGFSVSPISAGKVDDANRATSVVADYHAVQNAVNPIIDMMSQVLTRWVGPRFARPGEKLQLWIERAQPHDPEMHVRRWEVALKSRVKVSHNEARAGLLSLPPIEGGDQAYIDPLSPTEPVVPISAKTPQRIEHKKVERLSNKRIASIWLKQQSLQEQMMQTDILTFLQRQSDAILRKLDEFKSVKAAGQMATAIFNPSEWDPALIEAVTPHIRRQLIVGVEMERQIVESLRKQEDAIDPAVQAAVQQALDDILEQPYWSRINVHTRELLIASLEESFRLGENLNDRSARIRELLETNQHRAVRIARTESTSSINAGHHAQRRQFEQEGIVFGSEWLTIRDLDVRGLKPDDEADHASMHGVKVRPGEWFLVSGERAPYPGYHRLRAANRIQCRCLSAPVVVPF